jgi:hypothetical protein
VTVEFAARYLPKQARLMAAYEITMIVRNNGGAELRAAPTLRAYDANGLELMPITFKDYMAQAAALSGISVPNRMTPPYTTISSAGGFAGGFAQGLANSTAYLANAEASEAEDLRKLGRASMDWAQNFWLRDEYTIAPGSAIVAAQLFPSVQSRPLPLRVEVRLGRESFLFTTGTRVAQ